MGLVKCFIGQRGPDYQALYKYTWNDNLNWVYQQIPQDEIDDSVPLCNLVAASAPNEELSFSSVLHLRGKDTQ